MNPAGMSTADLVAYGLRQFRAERRERYVHAAGRGIRTHTDGERILHLPNGDIARVTTCEADVVTHVEWGDHVGAITRPAPYRPTPDEADVLNRFIRRYHFGGES